MPTNKTMAERVEQLAKILRRGKKSVPQLREISGLGKQHIEKILVGNPDHFRVAVGELILEAQVWELVT
jgi:hypothetical protein